MCNDAEGEPWRVEITLMYAQQVSYNTQPQPTSSEKKEPEKSLRELLEEQDIGTYELLKIHVCM